MCNIVKCSLCNKKKEHSGKGMCSACLRKTKRRTRPEFYLGTCYSEIKRRCNHRHKTRANKYLDMAYPTKEEFVNRFINDVDFLDQYRLWQESDFSRGSAPSIDRIDNDVGYDIENLRFIDNITNGIKDCCTEVGRYKEGELIAVYESIQETARQCDCNPGSVHRSITHGYRVKGYKYRRMNGKSREV